MIDPVTNLTELIRVDSKESDHIARKFAQAWLSRYPWSDCCIHDNGGKFTGHSFQKLLVQSNIIDVPTTSCNPMANAVCEHMHQSIGNILRTLVHENPPRGTRQAKELVKEALSIVQHVLRCSVHSTLGSSPESLVFNRDIFLNFPLVADRNLLTKRTQYLVSENLQHSNLKRQQFDYTIIQKV